MENLPKNTILLIDDEEFICEVAQAMFEREFDITVNTDPLQGIELIKEKKFDLIMTDLAMTPVDGLDVLAAAREHQPNTPVVVISGYLPDDEEIQKAITHGIDGVVTKPFPPIAQLRQTLRAFINGKQEPSTEKPKSRSAP